MSMIARPWTHSSVDDYHPQHMLSVSHNALVISAQNQPFSPHFPIFFTQAFPTAQRALIFTGSSGDSSPPSQTHLGPTFNVHLFLLPLGSVRATLFCVLIACNTIFFICESPGG